MASSPDRRIPAAASRQIRYRVGSRRLAHGPAAGLDPAPERYQPLHAVHAELLSLAGDAEGAASAYERAIAVTANAVERAELERRLGALR